MCRITVATLRRQPSGYSSAVVRPHQRPLSLIHISGPSSPFYPFNSSRRRQVSFTLLATSPHALICAQGQARTALVNEEAISRQWVVVRLRERHARCETLLCCRGLSRQHPRLSPRQDGAVEEAARVRMEGRSESCPKATGQPRIQSASITGNAVPQGRRISLLSCLITYSESTGRVWK